MTANVAVSCKMVEKSQTKEIKDVRDAKHLEKDQLKEIRDKRLEKPVTDKSLVTDKAAAHDKTLVEKRIEGKFTDGKLVEGGGPGGGLGGGLGAQSDAAFAQLEERVSALEAAMNSLSGAPTPQAYIGSQLRPDLSQSALAGEADYSQIHDQMRLGARDAKRTYDTKLKEQK
jgi:hypothetical protein